MKDQELDELLSSLRDEPWPEDRLVEWRERVRGRAARRSFGWWFWVPAPVLALACAFWIVTAISSTPHLKIESHPPAVVAEAWRTPRPRPAAPLAAVRRPSGVKTVRRIESSEFVRIVTDDPDVVILLAMNGKGDE